MEYNNCNKQIRQQYPYNNNLYFDKLAVGNSQIDYQLFQETQRQYVKSSRVRNFPKYPLADTSQACVAEQQAMKNLYQRKDNELPYCIKYLDKMGYAMVATCEIEGKSLLCEYGGVLTIFDNKQVEDEYVIIESDHKKNCYVINSTHYANEARFIAGIPTKLKNKANCLMTRLFYNDRPYVLVCSQKKIQENEIIYVDYGDKWNSSSFVYYKTYFDYLNQTKNVEYFSCKLLSEKQVSEHFQLYSEKHTDFQIK